MPKRPPTPKKKEERKTATPPHRLHARPEFPPGIEALECGLRPFQVLPTQQLVVHQHPGVGQGLGRRQAGSGVHASGEGGREGRRGEEVSLAGEGWTDHSLKIPSSPSLPPSLPPSLSPTHRSPRMRCLASGEMCSLSQRKGREGGRAGGRERENETNVYTSERKGYGTTPPSLPSSLPPAPYHVSNSNLNWAFLILAKSRRWSSS